MTTKLLKVTHNKGYHNSKLKFNLKQLRFHRRRETWFHTSPTSQAWRRRSCPPRPGNDWAGVTNCKAVRGNHVF